MNEGKSLSTKEAFNGVHRILKLNPEHYGLKGQDKYRGNEHEEHKDFCSTRSHTTSVPRLLPRIPTAHSSLPLQALEGSIFVFQIPYMKIICKMLITGILGWKNTYAITVTCKSQI